MSDQSGLMGGPVSLESESPAIVGPPPGGPPPEPPAPIQEAAPAEPAAAVPEPEEEPEGVVYDSQGHKLVPLTALQQTRQELKAAKALTAELDTLRQKAQQGEQIEQQINQLRPLLDKLKHRPDLVRAAMDGQTLPTAAPAQPAIDPDEALLPTQDAEDLARTLELYTPEGTPDLKRARKIAAVMRRSADEEASRKLAPLAQAMSAGQSGTLKAQYAQVKDKSGKTVNPAVLEQLWNIVPAELVARDPNVASVLYYAAKGYAAHHGLEEPAPPPRAPIVTESPGGGRPAAPVLNEFDQNMRRAMQVSEKQYAEAKSRYKPGAINVLE